MTEPNGDFRRLTAEQGPKANSVQQLFTEISDTYDTANDVITFGMARKWRQKLVNLSEVEEGQRVLDCATGTGDLALQFKRLVGPKGEVIGTDFCKGMLDLAPKKAHIQKLDVEFTLADVTELPYADAYFDVTSIAYGIRNVDAPVKALSEMARVTRPGGKVMILETGEEHNPILGWGIRLYTKHLVPLLGGLVSGNRSAYEYLNKSSKQFPCREKFLDLMNKTGAFSHTEYRSLMGGASFIYQGVVADSKEL